MKTTVNLTNFWGSMGQNLNKFPCKENEEPCALCGKPVKVPRFYFWVNGAQEAVLAKAHSDKDVLVPVGPECVKKHKALKPFIVTNNT